MGVLRGPRAGSNVMLATVGADAVRVAVGLADVAVADALAGATDWVRRTRGVRPSDGVTDGGGTENDAAGGATDGVDPASALSPPEPSVVTAATATPSTSARTIANTAINGDTAGRMSSSSSI